MKKIITYVLIADGARARIVLNDGPGRGFKPAYPNEFAGTTSRMRTRDLGADKPGRGFESADGSRHAMTPRADWHRNEKRQFAKSMARVLDEAADRKAFDRLILVAPPDSLGILRKALASKTRDLVTAEIAKDLTNTPVRNLPDYLKGVMVP